MFKFYVVATPIGNLQDITLRALETLRNSDVIICEDTRITARLLEKYEIKNKKLLTYNDNSDDKMRHKIVQLAQEGKIVSLVSDAGTPLISDPGYKLIQFLRKGNVKIIPIAGASSLTTALSAGGVSCDRFLFVGFLPSAKIQRQNELKELPKNFTLVFFESANRIEELLQDLLQIFGNRRIAIARELTKIHEEIINDNLENLQSFFAQNLEKIRGEFVIILEKANRNEQEIDDEKLQQEIKKALKSGLTIKELSESLAQIYNLHKKQVYQLALKLTKGL